MRAEKGLQNEKQHICLLLLVVYNLQGCFSEVVAAKSLGHCLLASWAEPRNLINQVLLPWPSLRIRVCKRWSGRWRTFSLNVCCYPVAW